jgi:hypothetical protein
MNKIYYIFLVAILAVSTFGFVSADPNGASTVTPETSTRGTTDPASNHSAFAGNVTELTITGNAITQSWQGYFGNVSGAIRLTDGSGNPMYNWSLATPSGEVFASTASSITWSSIDCFDWATDGVALETAFNIDDSADGVNETFSDSNAHVEFFVGSTTFTSGECMSTHIFDSTGASVDGNFEEVLLHDGTNTVFASLLENDLSGFDSASHDFEMLVLEDGHSGDISTTPYFFYVELE